MRNTIAALIVGSLVCASPLVLAQEPEESVAQEEEFKRLTTEATTAYTDGDYDRAAQLFQQAYEIRQVSNILYNIARIHEEAGNIDAAISYYDQFVVAPNVEQDARRDALDRLKTLREVQAVQEAEARGTTTPPPAVVEREEPAVPAPPEPEPRSNTGRTLGWVFIGAGAASLATSGVFAFLAQTSHDEFESATSLEDRRAAASTGRTRAVVADSLLATGLVTAVIGGVVLIATSGGGDSDATATRPWSVSPLLGSSGAGAALNVRF